MDAAAQARVYKRVQSSGALPIARDTSSYVAVMSVLSGASHEPEYIVMMMMMIVMLQEALLVN